MKIKKIEWRNFASYGNKLHTLDFSSNEGGKFYLLVGENGAGKSTIAEILKFGIYGKTGGSKNSKDLPNRFNGNLYVKITLETANKHNVTIERSLAPTKLNLTIDGVPYDQAGKKNIDDYIENEIVGIPFYVFNNIISLSINDFKSFLTMTPADKKQIIDKIFGLDIINAAKSLVKEEMKAIKANIESYESDVRLIEETIANAERELEGLKAKVKERDESKLKELNESLESYNDNIGKLNVKLNEIEEKLPKVVDKDDEIREKVIEIRNKIANAEEKKKLYDNKCCPMCGSDLTTDFHQSILDDLLQEIATSKETLTELAATGKKIALLKDKLKNARDDARSKKSEFEGLVRRLKIEIESLKDSGKNIDMTSIENIIASNKERKEETTTNAKKGSKQLSFFKIIEEIFSDSGIKKTAVAQIVPGINNELAKMLEKLNIQYMVKFDNEFEASIRQLKYEVRPQQLSTGEKKKIDFAILIAIIKLMVMKFPGLNVIFLDELFSSIDSDGIVQILEVLRDKTREMDINAFVVNHSPLPTEMFDYHARVTKTDNFSHLEVKEL